ncbi:nicotinamide riboside kinase 1 [Chelonus insularis]|uniref:nicotinamide riboside kinase 1 n=1 Tax=Chelonus insularis TaxID=460826 RepID=UPI001588E5DB|nr:nicotinamide riboside kinase 1 [Chelonus insularis]
MKELAMSITRWLVIGISGTTCSGKTTLAKRLHENFQNSKLISQDSYFLPENDPRHVNIPELNACNWELLSSLDMNKMHTDVFKILNMSNDYTIKQSNEKNKWPETRVLILEGFILFEDKKISDLCNLKYLLTLNKQQCWERRRNRVYDPPDVPGYFDSIVWPEYEKYLREIKQNKKLQEEIVFIDGGENKEEIFQRVFNDISKRL